MSGSLGHAENVSQAGGLNAWLGQRHGNLGESATSAQGETEQSWEAFCSLSCPGVNRTTVEQLMPKEMVMSFYCSCCHNLMSLS